MRIRPFLLLPLLLASAAQAADHPTPPSTGNLLQVLAGLIAVMVLMGLAAWALKRFGVSGAGGGGNVVKVIGGVSLGNRERIMVVEVADQWIVVGVAQGRVSALSTMPRQDRPAPPHRQQPSSAATDFAGWLKRTIDKRNGNS